MAIVTPKKTRFYPDRSSLSLVQEGPSAYSFASVPPYFSERETEIMEREFLNSHFFIVQENEYEQLLLEDKFDQILIGIQQKIQRQYEEMKEEWNSVNIWDIREGISMMLSNVLLLDLNIKKVELTSDESIFWTLNHQNLTLYVDHYVGGEEVNVVIFSGRQKLPGLSGNLSEVVHSLQELLNPQSTVGA